MKKLAITILTLLCFPNISISAANDEQLVKKAIDEMCKCGFPPSSRCMDEMARKFPRIDSDPNLQNAVMDGYQRKCGAGAMFGGKSQRGMPAAPAGGALGGIQQAVPNTTDCSTRSFSVSIPKGWQCRKQARNAQDVTLFAYGNKLNVTLGKNQGQTSCSVIPICKSAAYQLADGFESTQFTNPMIGTHEYSGFYKKDGSFKLTITSNTKPTGKQFGEIKAILESFRIK